MADATLGRGQQRERLVIAWGAAGAVFALALVAACLVVAWARPPVATLGNATDFAPGAATPLSIDVPFRDPLPPIYGNAAFGDGRGALVPIWLVNDPEAGWIAFLMRDPHNGCPVVYESQKEQFVDVCHGSRYSHTGEYLRGRSERGLDRFGVDVRHDGTLTLDPSSFQIGLPAP
jgi:Rieske Fe-S protein